MVLMATTGDDIRSQESCIQHGTWGPFCGPDCKQMTDAWNTPTPERKSKMQVLEERADRAYDKQDQAWFDRQPLEDLTALWGIACARPLGAAWDDEVFDALAKRGWFESVSTDTETGSKS